MHITTRNLLVASVVKVSNYLKTLTPSRIWTHDLQITSLMLCQLSYRWRLKSLIQSDLFWIFYSICLTSTSMYFVTVGLSQTSQARVNGPPLIPILIEVLLDCYWETSFNRTSRLVSSEARQVEPRMFWFTTWCEN